MGTPEQAGQGPVIFDTTLRDGAQMPGIRFAVEDKLAIAVQLAEVGVGVIEAGFPFSSEQNFEATKLIAETLNGPVICAFSRTAPGDIERAWEAIEPASHKGGARLNTCIPVSKLHMEKRLGMEPDRVLSLAVDSVKRARELTDDVEFSAEDASRADTDDGEFLTRIVLAAADAGATTIMIPDTVGKSLPHEYAALTGRVRHELDAAGFAGVVVAAHCHNDMGLAAVNTLYAVTEGGAGQIDVTVGGVGERAGNANLEQLVAIAHEREELGIQTGLDTVHLTRLVRDVARRGGVLLQPHLPVVGKNAFRHASGMHQDGVAKDRKTFEHMRAEDYGQQPAQFVISDQSGRAGISRHLEDIGLHLGQDELLHLRTAVERRLRETGRDSLGHSDLEELLAELNDEELTDRFALDFDELTEQTVKGISTVKVVVNGIEGRASSPKGPVDAAVMAINEATGLSASMEDWEADAPDVHESHSAAAVGAFAIVKLDGYDSVVGAYAVERSSDFASIAAYMTGLNMLARSQERTAALAAD